MELGLRGRTAVIAGASTGIGKASARGLAAEGVNLVLLARGKEALDQAVAEINGPLLPQPLSALAPSISSSTRRATACADQAGRFSGLMRTGKTMSTRR